MLIRSVATTAGRSRISQAPPVRCSAFCHLKMPAAILSKSFKGSQCGFVSIPTRIHPELDLMFVSNPDRTVPTILLGEDLKTIWQETSQLLWTEFVKLSVADWLQKHGAVSEEDFLREPHRNRFTVLLGRTGHITYHLGQAKLWERGQTWNIT